MPRPSDLGRSGFIWLPRTLVTVHKITINGEDVTTSVINSEFTGAGCPDVNSCLIELINSDAAYTNKYAMNQTVYLYMDLFDPSSLGTATTARFKLKIDSLQNKLSDEYGYIMEVQASQADVFDKLITKKCDGTQTINEILSEIIPTTYTLDYQANTTNYPTINWDNKPFWDCVNDLNKICDTSAITTVTDTVKFFDKGTVINTTDAIVWGDTLLNSQGLGTQIVSEKNKVNVIGDDGTGLPVLKVLNNSASQSAYSRIKEVAVFDSKVTSILMAEEIGQMTLNDSSNSTEGDVEAMLMPTLLPMDKVWITDPTMGIHGQYIVSSFTHRLPEETTVCTIDKSKELKDILKKRIETELASQKITNPFAMLESINYPFDDESDIASKDSNVSVSSGKIKLSSGSQGVITMNTRTFATTITEVHLRVTGSNVIGTTFQLSTDGGSNYESLALEGKTTLINPGNILVPKIILQSTTTEIDSIAILVKWA